MLLRFCIEQLNTGLYYLGGAWEEEPEWFDSNEAHRIARSLGDRHYEVAVRSHEFDASDCE
jgi:hypothetical protein